MTENNVILKKKPRKYFYPIQRDSKIRITSGTVYPKSIQKEISETP